MVIGIGPVEATHWRANVDSLASRRLPQATIFCHILPACSHESWFGGIAAHLRRPRLSWPRLEAVSSCFVSCVSLASDRHWLNGYFDQRVPSLFLPAVLGLCWIMQFEMYVSLEVQVPIKLGTYEAGTDLTKSETSPLRSVPSFLSVRSTWEQDKGG